MTVKELIDLVEEIRFKKLWNIKELCSDIDITTMSHWRITYEKCKPSNRTIKKLMGFAKREGYNVELTR